MGLVYLKKNKLIEAYGIRGKFICKELYCCVCLCFMEMKLLVDGLCYALISITLTFYCR